MLTLSRAQSKGQLISKCLFGALNFLQKQNENKSQSSKIEFLCSVFGGNVGLKKSFRFCLTFRFFLFILCIQCTLHTLVFTADIYPPPTTIIMVRLHVLWIMIAIASISILQSLPQPLGPEKFFAPTHRLCFKVTTEKER